VARLAAAQWGVVDVDDLRECGLLPDAIMRRERNGRLRRVHPGVYAVGHDCLTMRGQFLAAVKACGPHAVISHISAAALWHVLVWHGGPIHVTLPSRGTRTIPGIVVHRTRVPMEIVRLDGIPVTIPARTLIDLASLLPFKRLRRAVREALAQKRVAVGDLIAIRGRRGGALITTILADGYVPTRSELEDAVLDLMARGRIRRPDVNRRIRVDGGGPLTPDFRWSAERLVVEADGAAYHEHRLAREDDAERQARLEAAGERVIRISWRQAMALPAQTLTRLRAAGAPAA
jgi:very-short-patch-repair endonuclease